MESERQELLARRFTANDSTAIPLEDANLDFNDKLMNSNKHMDDLIDHGHSVLGKSRSDYIVK